MKFFRKLHAAPWIIAICISMLFTALPVMAAISGEGNSEAGLVATREGNVITVTLAARGNISQMAGMEVELTNDSKVTAPTTNDYTTPFDNTAFNAAEQFFSISHGGILNFSEGDSLLAINYTVTDGFQYDTEYTFTFDIQLAYTGLGFDISYMDMDQKKFSVTYIEHTVSFNLDGGDAGEGASETTYANQYIEDGNPATGPVVDPVKEGNTFKGWKKDDADFDFSTPITEKTELVAQWEANENTVKYALAEGSDAPEGYTVPTETTKAYGDEVTVETAPDATQYTSKDSIRGTWTFNGWNAPEGVTVAEGKFTMPNASVTFTGTWTFTATTHNIYYVISSDKPGTEPYGPKDVAVGSTQHMPDDLTTTVNTKDGIPGSWTFDGWTAPDGLSVAADGSFTMPDTDVTITGSWTFTPAKYTIKFVNDDGTELQSSQVTHGEMPAYSGETPAKADNVEASGTTKYTFNGWDKEIVAATGDTTYTAVYEENFTAKKYTITFQNEDGSETLQSSEWDYGTTPTYNGTTPTKAEDDNNTYTFAGWDADITTVTGNATYKAKFTANAKSNYNLVDPVLPVETEPTTPSTVTITWLNYDGSLIDKTTVNYNDTPSHTAPTAPTEEGKTYTWKGWSPTIVAAKADATYTAQFTVTTTTTDPDTGETETSTEDTTVPENPVIPENPDTPDPTNHSDVPEITTKGHTYEVYQIFTGDYAGVDDGNGGTKDVLSNIVWGVDGKLPEGKNVGDSVDDSILELLNGVVNEELDRTKLDVIEDYVNIDGSPYRIITLAEGDTQNTIQLPSGYYLIRDVSGSHSGDNQDHDAYTTYITVIIKSYTIQPKSVIPTVDKQVYDNADANGNAAGWAETADHAINESFQFALIATLPANSHYVDYSEYRLVFTDTMSSGVTFDSIASVKMGNTDLEYAVVGVEAGQAGRTWTLTTTLPKASNAEDATYSNLVNGATVTVIYNAHLNASAIKHKASDYGETANNTNENSVYLEYSNNPNTGGGEDMGKTETDNVWVFTYEVDNTKYAEEAKAGNELADAGFTLLKNGTAVKLIDNNDGSYTVADQTAASGTVTEMVTGNNGKFNILGLDAGTYTLRETTTPAGYNSIADTTVTITATHEETTTGASAKLNLINSNTENEIINQSGSTLPSTGGMGTRIFYILGIILVLGSGIVLVSKRRMNAE